MNMKKSLLASSLALLAIGILPATANQRAAMLIGSSDIESIENFQEYAAARHFATAHPDGVIIAPGETSKISADNIDCIWIHIDRLNIGMGNLPAEFSDAATVAALKAFVADGGSLLLTKQATQLLSRIDRIDAAFAPHIYADGDGGKGTDVWTVNAQIGYWFVNDKDNPEGLDPSQYYDHRDHDIYVGLETNYDFPMETFAMEGTGNGTEMWRVDPFARRPFAGCQAVGDDCALAVGCGLELNDAGHGVVLHMAPGAEHHGVVVVLKLLDGVLPLGGVGV